MRTPGCAACGGEMKRNGTTSAGRTRWRCKDPGCGSSASRSYDTRARDLRCGLDWLFSKSSQAEHRLPARTLRRRCELMWGLWPPVPLVDEVHRVVHVDGIHLHRDAVVLIAVAGGHVVGWHVARGERSAAWRCLMARIAPPDVLVCDGGGGMLKAAKEAWPGTRIQRCLFHVQANIFELTGARPRLEAGRRLRAIAVALPRVRDAAAAADWLASYNQWEQDFAGFLDEKSEYSDGSVNDMHQRLVRARRMIRRRIREGQLFTFLDEGLEAGGPVPSTNNLIESWNARLRDMLRRHRGLRLIRRLKAICWWCHQHTERPETDAWLAANAITDQQLENLYRKAWERSPQGMHETFGIPMRYGTGIDWNDFHTRVEWPSND
ncbi:IS1249 family transposase [Bifidobacterium sp. MA2]|uniref:Mutator family transposase n=1 Tax=Bifidobacterium santillanense TaxID=2809028 RepID=A0ABS5UTD2_9BIFI|nr:IS1249 family transposase [Bifidobacterium santillanense]MBT1173914.1 IS1249 family transposase [Bifidobacterium santillanense]